MLSPRNICVNSINVSLYVAANRSSVDRDHLNKAFLCSYRSWPNSNKINTHRGEIGRRILGHFSPHQCIRYCPFVFISSMPGVPVIKSASPD